MNGLRFLFLLDSGPPSWSSAEEHYFRLAHRLVSNGAVVVLIFSGSMREEDLARMRTSGAEVIAEARLHGARHFYGVVASAVRRFQINFAHIVFFPCHSPLNWFLRAHSVRRIVFTEAGSFLPSRRSPWHWKRVLTRARHKLGCLPLSRVTAISEFIRSRLVAYGVRATKIRLVYLGIDLERFAPDPEAGLAWRAENGIGANELVISTISRLAGDKMLDTLLRAFAELARRRVLARLFIAGKGPLESNLQALGRELGVADRIQWLGHVSNPARLLQGTDIFTLTSVGEAFGYALVEAMACGVPCVGTGCGGIPEIVDDEVTGLLAAAYDPPSFADAFQRLAASKDLRRKMGQAGMERAARLFAIDRSVDETLAVYEDLLD
jgi:glycosyltransferase involved in cell wall biosynthesis